MRFKMAHHIGAQLCTSTRIPTHFGSKLPVKAGRTPRKWARKASLTPKTLLFGALVWFLHFAGISA
jgi:hypothetical protein